MQAPPRFVQGGRMKKSGIAARLRRFFFPEKLTCACCGEELYTDAYFCPRCLARLPFNTGHICKKCGRAVAEEAPACLECKADMPSYEKARSAFRYEGDVVRLIRKYKTGAKHLAAPLAEAMLPLVRAEFAEADFLSSVPMTKRAKRRRGYDQGALLAEELAARSGLPYEAELLVKTRETRAQKKLSRRERAENLRGSFRVHERAKCRGRNILLVDDVLTTGATASAVAEALLRAGAARVFVLTAAGVPYAALRGGAGQGDRG